MTKEQAGAITLIALDIALAASDVPTGLTAAAWLITLAAFLLWTYKHLADRSKAHSRSFWLDAEERFRRIQGEVLLCVLVYTDGYSRWFVYPDRKEEGSPRTVEIFRAESERVGKALKKLRDAPSRYKPAADWSAEDYWLNAVAAVVDPENSISGGGRDDRGDHETYWITRGVHAAEVASGILGAKAHA